MIKPDWLAELNFAFSNKIDGQMSFKQGHLAQVLNNRTAFFQAYSLDLNSIVAGELVHGGTATVVTAEDRGKGAFQSNWVPGTDGLITNSNEVLLFTTHADCTPLIIYDRKHQLLGQAHAGWGGLVAGIVPSLINGMKKLAPPGDLNPLVWIGPSIRNCCYEIGAEVAAKFPSKCITHRKGQIFLSMQRFITETLIQTGITTSQITDSQICTCCHLEFSSYRRDGRGFSAMACVSGLK